MFTKKSHQDVNKSSVKIQDSKKDSATRLKHVKIVLDNYNSEKAKEYFEVNFSHVYFIFYENFLQAENNLRQKVHKAGKDELECSLWLLEKILCILPELIGRRWQLQSLTRIFMKLLHPGNSQKLRSEVIMHFLLWYQGLGDNAPPHVHKMFATLVPGMPEPMLTDSGTPVRKSDFMENHPNANEFNIEDIMQHPNFTDNAKKVIVEQTSTGIIEKIANVSASIFHDTNALNPVQTVDIQPLLPASSHERPQENETKFFLEVLLESMAVATTRLQWRDQSHAKAMRSFAFLLEKFKLYYLPVICPQYNHKNSLYKPNLELPQHYNILEDNFVTCRVTLIKWVATYAHFAKKPGSESGQPSSMVSTAGSHPSATPTPATSLHHEEETSFTVTNPSDSSRASSHDSATNTPHQSLDSELSTLEELNPKQVVRDVLCCWSREHVDFTIEVLRQAFLLPFSHTAALRRVVNVYKDWIQLNVQDIPPFLLENTFEQQSAASGASGGEPPLPPRRLRNDSYLGAVHRDNLMVRAGMQNVLQVFMTQACHVFVATPTGPVVSLHLEEQTDTCKRLLNIYRYMVMNVAMDANTWEQLLLVLLHITSAVLTKVPVNKKHGTLAGNLASALFQTLIVTWIKANLNVAVRSDLWQSFMELLARLTHWEELINEWAKTMETLTRVLARYVYALELNEAAEGGRRPRRLPPPPPQPPPRRHDQRPPGKSPKLCSEALQRKECQPTPRRLTRCRSEPQLHKQNRRQGQVKVQTVSRNDRESGVTAARRCYSLDSLPPQPTTDERDSASGTRSPSPAPSSGLESSSIKDSPMQLDLASDGGNVEWGEVEECGAASGVGVALGGTARGWLPDVAAVLWRRMLAALGDPNAMPDAHTHHQLYTYLVHLNSTLLKISANQTLNGNTEIHVPFNLVAGWCLEAETLPPSHRAGKLLALRLLCESTQAQEPGAPSICNNRLHLAHLPLYLRALHNGLTGEDRSVIDVLVEHAAPRFLSLALDGYSLLLLDFVRACTVVLNSNDMGPTCPRTAAVSFLGSLLSLPTSLMSAPVLQPTPHRYTTLSCPDLKEHVLNIIVRVCRREGSGTARVAGACALGVHVTQQLASCPTPTSGRHPAPAPAPAPGPPPAPGPAAAPSPALPAQVSCLLQMLTMKNKMIAKVVGDIIQVFADYTEQIVENYPGLAGKIIRWICATLAQISTTSSRDSVKPLAGSLLLTLAEFAVRCGPNYLMQEKDGDQTLLLMIFRVLHAVMEGSSGSDIPGLALQVDEDFDPNIQLDNLGPKESPASTMDVKLCAQTICTKLVLFLGHWPLWPSWQLSSSVSEQHDSTPNLGPELSAAVLTAGHVCPLRLSDTTLASFVQLPALHTAATTPGIVSSDKTARVILRELAGKFCWDAVALRHDPRSDPAPPKPLPPANDNPKDLTLSSLPPPLPADLVPDYINSPPDKHQLDHVLSYISHTSPEVSCRAGPGAAPGALGGAAGAGAGAEAALLAALAAAGNAERAHRDLDRQTPPPAPIVTTSPPPSASGFWSCCSLAAQLGLASAHRRPHTQLMKRTDRFLRELRNLDAQRCRETHKIAVIYVAKGQESRNEILSNRCGSPAFEAFLAALAWEVELESHVGFSGGLRGGGGGGTSAPYHASLTVETLFHVATRMPANHPDDILVKTRHLGNDEVHVVWSEHWRRYRRDTLPTQFCDVLVCLYPRAPGLLLATVTRKPHVPLFGPIHTETLIPTRCAAALVRGAALCGGRAVRATLPLYRHAYAERARSLHSVAAHHTRRATNEDFVLALRDPVHAPADHTDQAEGGRLAAALVEQGGWGAEGSPRAHKRAGPFRRPPASPPAPAPPRRNR